MDVRAHNLRLGEAVILDVAVTDGKRTEYVAWVVGIQRATPGGVDRVPIGTVAVDLEDAEGRSCFRTWPWDKSVNVRDYDRVSH